MNVPAFEDNADCNLIVLYSPMLISRSSPSEMTCLLSSKLAPIAERPVSVAIRMSPDVSCAKYVMLLAF